MGRKLRKTGAIFMVLALIYWQQSGTGGQAYAEEKPEKPDEPEKPEIVRFLEEIPEADGKNGYYVTKPEVRIRHVSEKGITKYRFTDSEGTKEEGALKQKDEELLLEKERFPEGESRLEAWMEDEEGKKIEEYTLERSFLVDTQSPSLTVSTPGGTEAWYQQETLLTAVGHDGERGSQLEQIVCMSGRDTIGVSKESKAAFRIREKSVRGNRIWVKVYAEDRAGNYAEEEVGLLIDGKAPEVLIEGIEKYQITSQPTEVIYHAKEENVLQSWNVRTVREDPEGSQTECQEIAWEETENGKRGRQVLSEDGVYRMNLTAEDKSGYRAEAASQIIIDKSNPVIRYVDSLDGKYMKSFCWDYPADQWIEDFTSFSYMIYLDGKIYTMGEEVKREGRHIMEVHAVDAAGNQGVARAEFTIDRTPPQITFSGIGEGEEYEEEITFRVMLKEQEDVVRQVKINGKSQKPDASRKLYEYTVREKGAVEVEVTAEDRAGNQRTERRAFRIVPKKTVFEKLLYPVEKAEQTEPRSAVKEESEKEEGSRMGLLAGATAAIGGGAALWYRKRK